MSYAAPSLAPVALITGAAAGIGRATALQLAADGWRCVLVDHQETALQALGADWPVEAPPPTLRCLDLSDAAAVQDLGADLPALSALINNAGLSAGGQDALGPDEALAQRLLAVNLAAPAQVVQSCARRLLPGARIVNVASGAGLRAIPWRGLYSASKAGLIAQTQALARARLDLTVNLLVPGFVRTEMVQGLIDQGRLQLQQALTKIPLGHLAEASDMAQALRFLVSPDASVLQGQALVLDGGSSVYGGSQALPLARHPLPSPALPLALTAAGGLPSDWIAMESELGDVPHGRLDPAAPQPAAPTSYAAVCDARALHAGPGGLLQAVRSAAHAFHQRHPTTASLTLLLPTQKDPVNWAQAGDAAAARMLIATLATEWGAVGLRINALLLDPDRTNSQIGPLLRYVASASARYLTGQCLTLQPHGHPEPGRSTP